jgi:hypothetical protein
MKALLYLVLAMLLVSSVGSADASGFSKHAHGKKAAVHFTGKHYKGHYKRAHHHKQA